MGVKGSVLVNFKVEPCSFTHKFVVSEGLTRPFILGEEGISQSSLFYPRSGLTTTRDLLNTETMS